MNKPALRFGILCNGYILQHWQCVIIRQLISDGHDLSLLVMPASQSGLANGIAKKKKRPFNQWLYLFCNRYIFQPEIRKPVDMFAELKHIPVQYCHVNTRGYSEYFNREDVDFIRNQNLDFILRFGFNIIRGDILDAPRYGIWSYHHSDEQVIRGGPPGLWEIFHAFPLTGSILQRMTNHLDGGIILKKGWFGTIQHSYNEQLNHVISGSIPFVQQVCNDILSGKHTYLSAPESKSLARIYRVPGNIAMLLFLIKLFINRIIFHLKDLLISEEWNIGIIEKPPEKVAFNWARYQKQVHWLKPLPSGQYRADAFLFGSQHHMHILCEHYNYSQMKGYIEWLIPDPANQWISAGKVVEDNSHFSFPFVFSTNDAFYCIPENYSSGASHLYLIDVENKQLVWQRKLIDQPLIDAVLLRYSGKWWLFATLPGNASGALYIWFANSLDEPFEEHPQNPVKTDIRSSRSAGPFIDVDGFLYRPAQNCSKTYGGSVVLHQVLTLTTEEYIEQPVIEIEPSKKWAYPKGIHTLAGTNTHTVIDAKRHTFIAKATINKLKNKFKRNQGKG